MVKWTYTNNGTVPWNIVYDNYDCDSDKMKADLNHYFNQYKTCHNNNTQCKQLGNCCECGNQILNYKRFMISNLNYKIDKTTNIYNFVC